jgi:hypothetical protein
MDDGLQVFITGCVIDVVPDLFSTGTDADNRLARHETPVLLLLWVSTELSLVHFFSQ